MKVPKNTKWHIKTPGGITGSFCVYLW